MTALDVPLLNVLRDGRGVVRIVNRLRAVGADVFYNDTALLQVPADLFFQSKPCVIRTDCDLHDVRPR